MIGMYNRPEDVAAFDHHYETVHAVLVAGLPGLRAFTMQRPEPAADGEAPAYHLVSTLTFDDETAFANALASDVGQRAVADLANFASAGVTIVTGPATSVMVAPGPGQRR
jgi:uncharacterized protein (TIGR02118 family)